MTEYDLAQREQLRQTLLAYMKEHKIGVPRLAARIKETVHRNPTVPVKTLQRFMKGEVRTIDMQVGFLIQFAEKVSKVDPTPRLGFALTAFYSSKDKTDWSGAFTLSEADSSDRGEDDHYTSKIEITADQGAWRVKEVSNTGGSYQIYDGVLSTSGPTMLIVMKHRLIGLPRTITISTRGFRRYEGVSTAAYYSANSASMIGPSTVKTRSARIALGASR
jgi:hypothetical protein